MHYSLFLYNIFRCYMGIVGKKISFYKIGASMNIFIKKVLSLLLLFTLVNRADTPLREVCYQGLLHEEGFKKTLKYKKHGMVLLK